jgi:hypothetical protein
VFLKKFVRGWCKAFVFVIEVYPVVIYLIDKSAVEVWSIPHIFGNESIPYFYSTFVSDM